MTSWNDFAAEEPDFAQRVRALFTAHKHHTMATLRTDGAPRISGTEVDFGEDGLALGMMGGSLRAADLRRDGRVALHSCTADPDEDPIAWPGDAKISGTACSAPRRPSERAFIDGAHRDRVVIDRPCFERADPLVFDRQGSYVETEATFAHTTTYEWNHGLGETLGALLAAGMTLVEREEHDSVPWEAIPGQMTRDEHGEWRLSERPWRLAASCTLVAVRP